MKPYQQRLHEHRAASIIQALYRGNKSRVQTRHFRRNVLHGHLSPHSDRYRLSQTTLELEAMQVREAASQQTMDAMRRELADAKSDAACLRRQLEGVFKGATAYETA